MRSLFYGWIICATVGATLTVAGVKDVVKAQSGGGCNDLYSQAKGMTFTNGPCGQQCCNQGDPCFEYRQNDLPCAYNSSAQGFNCTGPTPTPWYMYSGTCNILNQCINVQGVSGTYNAYPMTNCSG